MTNQGIDERVLNEYIKLLSENKPNLSKLQKDQISELMSITVNGKYTLATTILFGLYPQAYFPQLCIIATAIPGTEIGAIGKDEANYR